MQAQTLLAPISPSHVLENFICEAKSFASYDISTLDSNNMFVTSFNSINNVISAFKVPGAH